MYKKKFLKSLTLIYLLLIGVGFLFAQNYFSKPDQVWFSNWARIKDAHQHKPLAPKGLSTYDQLLMVDAFDSNFVSKYYMEPQPEITFLSSSKSAIIDWQKSTLLHNPDKMYLRRLLDEYKKRN